MELHETQRDAVRQAVSWFTDSDSKRFVLTGQAGTGKSTLVNYIINELQIEPNKVAFIAPTGKAAMVLRKKDILEAGTLHSLIYIPFERMKYISQEEFEAYREELSEINNEKQQPLPIKLGRQMASNVSRRVEDDIDFFPKAKLDADYKLIVCDEASMLNDKQIHDLERYGVKVLYLGDHRQVKPVEGINSLIRNPNITLSKIFRQADGNSIIDVACDVLETRNGIIPCGKYGANVIKLSFSDYLQNEEKLLQFPTQILCMKNNTRKILNAKIRKLLGRKYYLPNVGERLMILRNNPTYSIVNGMQGIVERIDATKHTTFCYVTIDFLTEEGNLIENMILSLDNFNDDIAERVSNKTKKLWAKADFGYACTVHKAQGSQWENVLLFEESFKDLREMVYTGVTRAEKKLIIVAQPTAEEYEHFCNSLL